MAEWKYVMFQDADGRCIPVIFPGSLVHLDVARSVRAALPRGNAVVSAGHIGALHVSSAFGESETLQVKAYEKDADVINHYPYSGGMPDALPNMAEIVRLAYLKLILPDEQPVRRPRSKFGKGYK